MGSKQLKSVKTQNKVMKDVMKTQKSEEKQAVDAYKQAKAAAGPGLIKSKTDRQNIKAAKANMKREKAETKYGKQVQKQGKQLQKNIASESKILGGLAHSDRKISAQTRNQATQFTASAQSFVANTKTGSAKQLNQITKADKTAGKAVSKATGTAARKLPSIADSLNIEKAVNNAFGLGE